MFHRACKRPEALGACATCCQRHGVTCLATAARNHSEKRRKADTGGIRLFRAREGQLGTAGAPVWAPEGGVTAA